MSQQVLHTVTEGLYQITALANATHSLLQCEDDAETSDANWQVRKLLKLIAEASNRGSDALNRIDWPKA